MDNIFNKNYIPLIISIIGIILIFIGMILGIISGLIYFSLIGEYVSDKTFLAGGFSRLAEAFFWGGVGANLFAILLTLRKKIGGL